MAAETAPASLSSVPCLGTILIYQPLALDSAVLACSSDIYLPSIALNVLHRHFS